MSLERHLKNSFCSWVPTTDEELEEAFRREAKSTWWDFKSFNYEDTK